MFGADVTGAANATYLIWLCTPPDAVHVALATTALSDIRTNRSASFALFPVTKTRPSDVTSNGLAPTCNCVRPHPLYVFQESPAVKPRYQSCLLACRRNIRGLRAVTVTCRRCLAPPRPPVAAVH